MKKVSLFLFVMMLTVGVMAQQSIPLRSANKAECVKSDMRSLKASFSFSTIDAQDYESERGTFSWLSLPNTVIGGNEGDPQIPVVNELIAVPFGANPRIEITSYSTTDYRLEDYGIHTLVPRQPSLRKDQRPEDVPFVYNEAAYQSTRGFRSVPSATVSVEGTMRGIRLGKMTIEPVSYDPVNNTLRVFNNIEVTIHFDGADAAATEQMLIDTYSPYFDVVYAKMFNGRSLRDAYSSHPDLYTTPVKMLVITTSTYANNTTFQNWINWKKQKGIYVDVYTTAQTGTSAASIKSFIQTQYNQNHPTFLVIVGDSGDVVQSATGSASAKHTDLYYSSTDGDIYPDIYTSRMPVSSSNELTYLLTKTLQYEQYTMPDPSYLDETLLIAGWDSSWTPKVGIPTIQYANTYYYNSSNGITADVFLTTGSGQTTCYNYINQVGFVNYTAHGSQTGWADPSFDVSNVNSMTNTDKYFWAMGNCCLAADWGYSGTCFAEAMVRAQNKGAFGYIGSCPSTYWWEDYYFGVGATSVYNQMPTQSQTQTGVYDAMFDDSGFNTLNAVPFFGNLAVCYAHANGYTSSSTATDTYYWEAYHCLGDGSVMPYHKNPSANQVSHASTISIGASTFTVNAIAGSYVAITKNNEILGVAEVPSSGTVNVPIEGLTSAGNVMIVVTRQQHQPYVATIQAVSANGPYISLDSYTPNTALVGENTYLSLTFKNVGNAATSGSTTVTLSSTNSNVTIISDPQTFGALAANASTTVNGFCFRLNPGVTLGTNVILHYTAVNSSDTWEGDIAITPDQIFTVTVTSNNSNYGSVSGGGTFHYGASCTVNATPADDYMFTSWTNNNNVVSTNAQYTFNVTSDINLVANFAEGLIIGDGTNTSEILPSYNYYKYTLSEQIYTPAELGRAGIISSIAFYNGGAEKTRTYDFYMKATTKSSFSNTTDWVSVSASDKVFSGTVTMVANDWTTITFSTPFYYDGTSNVLLVADDNTGEYSYSPHMACRVFTATSQALYVYSDGTNYNPLSPPTSYGNYEYYSVLSVKNQLIVSKESSSVNYYNITVTTDPTEGGTVSGEGQYAEGAQVTLTATPATGYTFTNWKKNGTEVSTNATYTFTVNESATFTATFTAIPQDNYTVTISPNPAEGGIVVFGDRGNRNELYYDFEDGWQNWTALKGNTGTSPHNWMHNTEYLAYDANGNQIIPQCHNSSSGMMLSESYISNSTSGSEDATAVYPDNYLVSPQIRLGGSISFYAASRMSNYPAEKFSVLVSETGNNSTNDFTHTELTVTLEDNNWHEYTIDLSAYSGMGYVAIRHYDCYDQHLLYIDDVTIVEGSTGGGDTPDPNVTTAIFNHGESCTVTAIPNTGYSFVNWTENGTSVSSSSSYTFTVSSDRNLVANFVEGLVDNILIGDGGTEVLQYLPSFSYYKFTLSEQIYTVAELGEAGLINSIAFYNSGAEKTRTYDFYMKHTEKDLFLSTTDWETVSASDKVFSGEVTMIADAWTVITLDSPFFYNGTSNVVLVTDDNSNDWTGSPHMACRVFNAPSQAIRVYADNTNFNPMEPPTSYADNEYAELHSVKNQLLLTKEVMSDCMTPTQLTATEVGNNFVKLSWVEHGASEQWYVVYDNNAVPANTNEDFILEGLDPETQYTIMVRPACDENLLSNAITITTLEACPAPSNVEMSNITSNAATVTWNGFNDSYNVQLGLTGLLLSENFNNGIPSNWNNSSNYPWTIVDGHIQSGNAGVPNSESVISMTVTFITDGTVEFDAECLGEGTSTYWDHCDFYIDDTRVLYIGGDVLGWNHYSFNVTAGEHTFTWSYTKDGSVNPAGDYFAIDNVMMGSNETVWNDPVAVEDTEYRFTGLNLLTTYSVRVQSVCGDFESAWSEIVVFMTTDTKRFVIAGNWDMADNWSPVGLPVEGEDVIIDAAASIPSGYLANVGNITNNATITIKDGGQLKHTNESIIVTLEKEITGYGESTENNHYYFIAPAPFSQTILPTSDAVENMISNEYDLYSFTAAVEDGREWINQKSSSNFKLRSAHGYLYANSDTVTLRTTGPALSSVSGGASLSINYNPNASYVLNGWYLAGNPYVCNGYVYFVDNSNQIVETDFYRINENGDGYDIISSSDALAPFEGVFVYTENSGSIKFSVEPIESNRGKLNMNLTCNGARIDMARVRFGEGRSLPKSQIRENSTRLFIRQDGKDYAVVSTEGIGEMLVGIKVEQSDSYTLSFSNENVEFTYLHLIDNMTGVDIDLLQTPSYTFEANTTDHENRFKLVFVCERK